MKKRKKLKHKEYLFCVTLDFVEHSTHFKVPFLLYECDVTSEHRMSEEISNGEWTAV